MGIELIDVPRRWLQAVFSLRHETAQIGREAQGMTAASEGRLTLTVPEVAEELRLSDRTVWKLIRDGKLPSVKVGGGRRIVREALDTYIASLTS